MIEKTWVSTAKIIVNKTQREKAYITWAKKQKRPTLHEFDNYVYEKGLEVLQ